MNDAVRALIELGEIDAELSKLRGTLAAMPSEADEFRSRLGAAEVAASQAAERVRELKLESDRKNLEFRGHEEQLEKLQTQLNAAKSNKEYDLIREQMKEIEEQSSKLEEEILSSLEEIDAIDAASAERDAELEAARRELDQKLGEIDARATELGSRVADLAARRDDKASRVDSEDLARYQRVLDNWGDTAVAMVDRDDGVCSLCNMRLTPQQLNTVMAGHDIIQCQSCRRILYIGEPVT